MTEPTIPPTESPRRTEPVPVDGAYSVSRGGVNEWRVITEDVVNRDREPIGERRSAMMRSSEADRPDEPAMLSLSEVVHANLGAFREPVFGYINGNTPPTPSEEITFRYNVTVGGNPSVIVDRVEGVKASEPSDKAFPRGPEEPFPQIEFNTPEVQNILKEASKKSIEAEKLRIEFEISERSDGLSEILAKVSEKRRQYVSLLRKRDQLDSVEFKDLTEEITAIENSGFWKTWMIDERNGILDFVSQDVVDVPANFGRFRARVELSGNVWVYPFQNNVSTPKFGPHPRLNHGTIFGLPDEDEEEAAVAIDFSENLARLQLSYVLQEIRSALADSGLNDTQLSRIGGQVVNPNPPRRQKTFCEGDTIRYIHTSRWCHQAGLVIGAEYTVDSVRESSESRDTPELFSVCLTTGSPYILPGSSFELTKEK